MTEILVLAGIGAIVWGLAKLMERRVLNLRRSAKSKRRQLVPSSAKQGTALAEPRQSAAFPVIRADLDDPLVLELAYQLEAALEQHKACLESGLPEPAQASLDAMLASVTRVRVVERAEPAVEAVLVDTENPASIGALRSALAIMDGLILHTTVFHVGRAPPGALATSV